MLKTSYISSDEIPPRCSMIVKIGSTGQAFVSKTAVTPGGRMRGTFSV